MASRIKTMAAVTVAVSNTAQRLSTGQEKGSTINLTAPSTNAAVIYIGDANVSSTRYLLKIAASESKSIGADNVVGTTDELEFKEIYIYGTALDVLHVGYQERSN